MPFSVSRNSVESKAGVFSANVKISREAEYHTVLVRVPIEKNMGGIAIDPFRHERVHVAGLRQIDGKYFIMLSDNSKVEWNSWISMDENERKTW